MTRDKADMTHITSYRNVISIEHTAAAQLLLLLSASFDVLRKEDVYKD